MGREVRKVPANWQHPKDESGYYIPLFDGRDLERLTREWDREAAQWDAGFVSDHKGGWRPRGPEHAGAYAEWAGQRPDAEDYMPAWPDHERTHFMMYEDTTEGTPISPAFETPEELARWLSDNNASAFGGMTATYDEWLRAARRGWTPSAIYSPATGLVSGVEGLEGT